MVSADRGLINGTRFGALKALRAFSILSSADLPSRCYCTCAISSFLGGLCCTNSVWDSSHESSVVAGMHEQTYTRNLQDQELASIQ
jgi:hypothetical protein